MYESNEKDRLMQAFKYNKALPYDLLKISYYYYKQGNQKKGEKFLFRSASKGENVLDTFFGNYYDSLFKADEEVGKKYQKKYIKALKRSDIYNSIEVIKLFNNDQHIRSYFRSYEQDKSFKIYKWQEVRKIDSSNYFALIRIMKLAHFDSKKLTLDAQEALGILLTHSLTNDYVNPDSVITLLKSEMLKGVIDPIFFANAIDRYYFANKGMNFYCNFYDSASPIFDIANLDKRRSEIFLYPLYFKFKWNNRMFQLPTEYKFDPYCPVKN
jgi:hypothetical protein